MNCYGFIETVYCRCSLNRRAI